MTIKNGDLPAMPVYTSSGDVINAYDLEDMITNFNVSYGLTKREQFAAMAMQGLLSGDNADGTLYETSEEWVKNVTEASVEFADALLAELERTK